MTEEHEKFINKTLSKVASVIGESNIAEIHRAVNKSISSAGSCELHESITQFGMLSYLVPGLRAKVGDALKYELDNAMEQITNFTASEIVNKTRESCCRCDVK